MSALRGDAATFWRRSGDGWERRVARGCRVEGALSSSTAAVGPDASPKLSVYVFGEAPVAEPGGSCMAGEHGGDEPPAGALRVGAVRPYTLGGLPHHVEVVCP